jgi:hypothetical protein
MDLHLFELLDPDPEAESGVKQKSKTISHIFFGILSHKIRIISESRIRACSDLTHLAKSISTRLSGQELQR